MKRFAFVLFSDYKFTKFFSISVLFCRLFHTQFATILCPIKGWETSVNNLKDSVATEKVEPIKEDNSIGKWRKEYYKDEFGETLEDEPYIVISLNAHEASKPHDDEYIYIQYAKNSEMEYFVICNNEIIYRVRPGENEGPSVLIKKMGEVEEIEVVKRRGYAYIFEEWGRRTFADLVAEGNFILKVGNYIVEIKDETKGFRNALILLGDIEIQKPWFAHDETEE